MNTDIQIFNNTDFGEVRVIDVDGAPWFVAADVCKALDLDNTSQALARLDDDEKNTVILNEGIVGNPCKAIVSEAGLYTLILSSRKPNAKLFKRWITHEVIPSIRKHGVYATGDFLTRSIADPAWAIGVLTELKAKQQETALLKVQLAEAKPKVEYCDVILNCADLVPTSVIAKDYGLSAKRFNKLLYQLKIQFKQGDIWLLYQSYAAKGWAQTKTFSYIGVDGRQHCKIHMYWTQKGRIELYHLLKRNGYLPLIEQAA